MSRRKVAVALSGGVDSSVAAALLKEEGHEVIGVHMKLWRHGPRSEASPGENDARAVCDTLGIPFHSLDFSSPFQEHVVNYFCGEYAQGRTPNPCAVCNRLIKFGLLLQAINDLGADCLATGHYARIGVSGGSFHLLKAARPSVDQSYFLYTLKQALLPRLLFPLGGYSKAQVRQMAAERGLPVAEKRKSQDLCFVPEGDHERFLRGRITAQPGDIVGPSGEILGRHRGIAFYTVGQRTGLGIATGQRLFVSRIDPVSNTIFVGPEKDLLASRLRAGNLSFVCVKPRRALEVSAKIRFRSPEVSARLKVFSEDAEVDFEEPQRAIAPGQAVVFYRGDEVLGGGIIEAS
ncbi:MAG: tRNA 2-thiouridine(34) synthase MnmA [Dehalococcoidia bacterium]|nr:tRNA 2-thiouridine(34) synthase MnmA [Dehalococcoidia bacterium]